MRTNYKIGLLPFDALTQFDHATIIYSCLCKVNDITRTTTSLSHQDLLLNFSPCSNLLNTQLYQYFMFITYNVSLFTMQMCTLFCKILFLTSFIFIYVHSPWDMNVTRNIWLINTPSADKRKVQFNIIGLIGTKNWCHKSVQKNSTCIASS